MDDQTSELYPAGMDDPTPGPRESFVRSAMPASDVDDRWSEPGEWSWFHCTGCGWHRYLTNYPFSVTLEHLECPGRIVRCNCSRVPPHLAGERMRIQPPLGVTELDELA